jgi:hypothetical protein
MSQSQASFSCKPGSYKSEPHPEFLYGNAQTASDEIVYFNFSSKDELTEQVFASSNLRVVVLPGLESLALSRRHLSSCHPLPIFSS